MEEEQQQQPPNLEQEEEDMTRITPRHTPQKSGSEVVLNPRSPLRISYLYNSKNNPRSLRKSFVKKVEKQTFEKGFEIECPRVAEIIC